MKKDKNSSKPFRPLSNILVKPAGPDCNLACQYCFYLEKSELFSETSVHRMSDDVLQKTIQQLMEQGTRNISIAWQGGEPTLMRLDFYAKAIEYQRQYGPDKMIGNSLQTNGMLINEKWADFLRINNFLVGLSIDGTRHIHDHYRKYRNGNGSWKDVTRIARLLLENQVAVNALTTVTDYSVQFPDEIYNFLKDIGFRYMQFIPIVESSKDRKSETSFSVNPEDYGLFLCRLFDRWMDDFHNGEPTTFIRYFESIFYRYVNMIPPDCTLMESCGSYVVVEYNGDVYSCDFFVEPKWKLGNVLNDRLIDMLNSSNQQKFGNQKSDLHVSCQTCEWLTYCYGGCTKDRRRDHRTDGLNYFCESTKIFFKHANSQLRELADEWKQVNLPQKTEIFNLIQRN